jgi:hypothetical protein
VSLIEPVSFFREEFYFWIHCRQTARVFRKSKST